MNSNAHNKYPKDYKKRYWSTVRRIAWNSAWDRAGMKAIISVLVIVILFNFFSGFLALYGWVSYPFFKENLIASSLTGLAQVILSTLVLVFLYVWLLYETPAKLDQDKSTIIKKLKRELKKINKELESEIVDVDVSLLSHSLDSDKVYALLDVVNNEKVKNIINCRVKLMKFFMSKDDEGGIMDFTDSITAIDYPFFCWLENNDKYTDIEHAHKKILCIGTAKENRYFHLNILGEDNFDFPAITMKNGTRMYEIRFKLEISGNVRDADHVFYEYFCGKVVYKVASTHDGVLVDNIDFREISDEELAGKGSPTKRAADLG